MRRLIPAGVLPAGFAGLLVFALACATAPVTEPPPEPHIPKSETDYFRNPLPDFPLAADPELSRRVEQGFGALEAGGDLAAAEAAARAVLEEDPGFHPAQVLLAQIAFIGSDYQGALDLLGPVADELPDYLACQLLLGRAAEELGDLPLALTSFRKAARGSSVARQRMKELSPRVTEILLARVDDLVARGHLEEADRQLTELETWAGVALSVLEARHALELAEGDVQGELDALEWLVAEQPDNDKWIERLGDLEITTGKVREGLEKLEGLAAKRPGDEELAEKVERAKFVWRLQLLPTYVQEIAAKGVLDRADVATLLYWLVPSVRYAQVEDPPIATDILEHPRREEILRVINLELITIDVTLHQFSPSEDATRALVLSSLLGLLRLSDAEFACLSNAEARALSSSRGLTCRKAAQCRLIPEQADCLPRASTSGPEALDLFRRTLDLLGSG